MVISTLTLIGLQFFLWSSIFESSGKDIIQGYTFEQMILYFSILYLSQELIRGTERGNGIAEEIYFGHLNRYLIYPVSVFGVLFDPQDDSRKKMDRKTIRLSGFT